MPVCVGLARAFVPHDGPNSLASCAALLSCLRRRRPCSWRRSFAASTAHRKPVRSHGSSPSRAGGCFFPGTDLALSPERDVAKLRTADPVSVRPYHPSEWFPYQVRTGIHTARSTLASEGVEGTDRQNFPGCDARIPVVSAGTMVPSRNVPALQCRDSAPRSLLHSPGSHPRASPMARTLARPRDDRAIRPRDLSPTIDGERSQPAGRVEEFHGPSCVRRRETMGGTPSRPLRDGEPSDVCSPTAVRFSSACGLPGVRSP